MRMSFCGFLFSGHFPVRHFPDSSFLICPSFSGRAFSASSCTRACLLHARVPGAKAGHGERGCDGRNINFSQKPCKLDPTKRFRRSPASPTVFSYRHRRRFDRHATAKRLKCSEQLITSLASAEPQASFCPGQGILEHTDNNRSPTMPSSLRRRHYRKAEPQLVRRTFHSRTTLSGLATLSLHAHDHTQSPATFL